MLAAAAALLFKRPDAQERTNEGERTHGQEWKTKRERMKTEKKGGNHPN
jgi:hypothetical protein